MPDLRATQQTVLDTLRRTGAPGAAVALFTSDPHTIDERLSIYRGNAIGAICKALTLTYPVLAQVVGDEYFAALARAYWFATPSVTGDLADYGASLGSFLESFEPTRELPYLADLARLEWLVHGAQDARDELPYDIAGLAALPAQAQEELRLVPSVAAGLVRSSWPIVRIWTIHQPGSNGEFTVDWTNPEAALVTRDGVAVRVRCVDTSTATLFEQVLAGRSIAQCVEALISQDAHADPGAALIALVGSGAITAHQVDQF
jgi:uncharacterized protein